MIQISLDKSKLQIDVIHRFLTETYWAKGRSIDEVKKSIENSLCYGVYIDEEQIGFARIVTDYTVFVYLMDVFILPEHRSKGYSKRLIKVMIENSKLKTCKVWMLKTSDAHGLYKQFDFTGLKNPVKVMERLLL